MGVLLASMHTKKNSDPTTRVQTRHQILDSGGVDRHWYGHKKKGHIGGVLRTNNPRCGTDDTCATYRE